MAVVPFAIVVESESSGGDRDYRVVDAPTPDNSGGARLLVTTTASWTRNRWLSDSQAVFC